MDQEASHEASVAKISQRAIGIKIVGYDAPEPIARLARDNGFNEVEVRIDGEMSATEYREDRLLLNVTPSGVVYRVLRG